MKHLKIFETFDEEYNIGDCVIVISEFNNIDDEPMIIISDNDFGSYTCKFLNQGSHDYPDVKIYPDEITRKATSEDLEISKMSITTSKFNL